ncbi:MAG: FAD:protein FMN transferase [Alphaproteobacteria bacterium]|nr:FAD:protein FMN transferase [Alphaproteobacteria bacterium]
MPAKSIQTPISRRRFIAVLASGIPLAKVGAAAAAVTRPVHWRGIAMGAQAEIVLLHPEAAVARKALAAAILEITRLENLFSLYEPNSEISRLNHAGYVEAPSPDLVRLLSEARSISEATAGAFDVTVQPLFLAYQRHGGAEPPAAEIVQTRGLVDQRKLRISHAKLAFERQGMAVTLNGIAQGYMSDRVSELLRRHGFDRTLVNLGEIRANGAGPDGRGWPLSIAQPDNSGGMLEQLRLTNRAVATSAASGHRFSPQGSLHHLIAPGSGRPSNNYQSLSVLAPTATLADGLSTGLSSIRPDALASIVSDFTAVEVIAKTAAGVLLRI